MIHRWIILSISLCCFQLCQCNWMDCSSLLIYHRIQKSGSTCIAEALQAVVQRQCRSSSVYVSFELRRDHLGNLYDTDVVADAAAAYSPRLGLLHGHFYYGIHNALPLQGRSVRYIISMVEPLQRAVSHFNFRKRIGLLQKQLGVSEREQVTWKRFLEQPAVLMCNEAVAALSGADRLHQRCSDYTTADYELLYQAKQNLRQHYDFIFLRSHMQLSWQMMHSLLPVFPSSPRCGWDNVSRSQKELPTSLQLQKLKRAFQLDRLLYRYAEKLFFERAAQLGFVFTEI